MTIPLGEEVSDLRQPSSHDPGVPTSIPTIVSKPLVISVELGQAVTNWNQLQGYALPMAVSSPSILFCTSNYSDIYCPI